MTQALHYRLSGALSALRGSVWFNFAWPCVQAPNLMFVFVISFFKMSISGVFYYSSFVHANRPAVLEGFFCTIQSPSL